MGGREVAEPLRPFHWRITLLAGLAFAGNGIDAGVVSFALPGVRADWGLTPGELGLILPAIGLGQLIGAIGCGSLADRFGRRWMFCTSAMVAGLGTGLAGLAPSPLILALVLFGSGLGFGAIAPVAGALVSEFAPPAHRGRLIGVTQVLWVLGWSAAALGGGWFAEQLGWRGILGLGAAPIAVALVGVFLVPESPRFLVARGRRREALDLSARMKRRHGIELPIAELPTRDTAGLPGPRENLAAAPLLGFAELWGARFRRRTFTLWTTWLAMNAAYTGPITWLPVLLVSAGSARALELSALVGFSMVPATILSSLLIDRVGRKPLMQGSLGAAAIGSVILVLGRSDPVMTFGAIGVAGGILAAWPVVLSWAAEQYPTRIRATASGWASGFARLGSICAPVVIGLLLGVASESLTLALLPFAALLCGAVVSVTVFARETMGRTLEETSE